MPIITGESGAAQGGQRAPASDKPIKCVVWDLDDTLWQGTLLEDSAITLRPGMVEIIKELDRRGILQSIASKNDPALALARMQALQISDYFIYPQIGWSEKSAAVKRLAAQLNLGLDAMALVDDQAFEREEVQFVYPQVACFEAENLDELLSHPRLNPKFVSEESRNRRLMYRAEIERRQEEERFTGPKEEFLASLGMRFTIAPAGVGDLQRAAELTERTNQLNTTGYTYSCDELEQFRNSPDHILVMASLEDKFGSYGSIGLVLAERREALMLKLLLVSCRVMSRGVGMVLLQYFMNLAKSERMSLLAEFLPNDRNRMMYVSYRFAGFYEHEKRGDVVILKHDLDTIPPFPDYIQVIAP